PPARTPARRWSRAPSSPTSGCPPCSRSARSQQALRARQHPREPAILCAGHPQRARERLEDRLNLVMARAAVEDLDVDVRPRADGEALEEIVHQLGLEIADLDDLDLQVDGRVRAPAEIDRRDRERLVHRHDEVAGAIDPAPVAERLRHRFAERDAEILDRVVLVDVEIAARVNPQVEGAVARHQLQHVIEKTDAGADVVPPLALERDRQLDLRLGRLPVDYGAEHSTSSMTAIARRVWSTIPVAMRRQPAHPGSVERSRR